MNGAERERLQQALELLIEAQREALEVVGQALEPDIGGLDEDERLEASERLEAALEDVGAILDGAQDDLRGILEGGL